MNSDSDGSDEFDRWEQQYERDEREIVPGYEAVQSRLLYDM